MSGKTKIICEIDCDGEYCGKCDNGVDNYCMLFYEYIKSNSGEDERPKYNRCPECITAQEAAKRAIVPKYNVGQIEIFFVHRRHGTLGMPHSANL